LIPLVLWVNLAWDLLTHLRLAMQWSSENRSQPWLDQLVASEWLPLGIGVAYFLCAMIWVLRPRIPKIAKSIIVAFEVLYVIWVVLLAFAEAVG
jgi:hypothetical protein